MPMSRITELVASDEGWRWLTTELTPSAPRKPVNASPTGSRAATRAPNANRRITSVIGTVSCSALRKSSPTVLFSTCARAGQPELLDDEAGVPLLLGGDGVQDRLYVLARDLADLPHLELDERRVPVA